MKAYLALFRSNLQLTLRDRSVLFFNYLFPFIFFFGFAELFNAGAGGGTAYFVGTVLTMGILGNGLWGAGMRAVADREANILRRFKVTPISPMPILIAAMVSGWLLYLPMVVMLIAAAHFVYGMALPANGFSLLIMVTLGVCAFRAIGLILASVTNTSQEAMIGIQLLYMPMLFLSGATVPSAMLPKWAQTAAEIADNAPAAGALVVTVLLGMFLAMQLFRWEKEEKLRARNKLWVLAVLGPFLIMGGFRAYTKEHLGQNAALFRDLRRADSFLIRGARVFVGDGAVIENGSVLVRAGRIAEVFEGAGPNPGTIKADIVEGAGKTLLPGLIDAHVHLGNPGGISTSPGDYDFRQSMPRAAAALLYSGVTAARSTGDAIDASLALRAQIAGGSNSARSSSCAVPCSRPKEDTAPNSSSTSRSRSAEWYASRWCAHPKTPRKLVNRCASSNPRASIA